MGHKQSRADILYPFIKNLNARVRRQNVRRKMKVYVPEAHDMSGLLLSSIPEADKAIAAETSQLPINIVESYNFPYSAILRAIMSRIELYENTELKNTVRFVNLFC